MARSGFISGADRHPQSENDAARGPPSTTVAMSKVPRTTRLNGRDGTASPAEFELAEPGETPMVVRIRGLTGVWTINPKTAADPTGAGGMTMGAQP